MAGRIVLLVTSPRLPAGLLTAQAWDLVRAHPVWTAEDTPLVAALRAAGAEVRVAGTTVDELVVAGGAGGTLVWLAGPDGDPDLARELGLRLAREPNLAVLEVVYGSWDPPGARLLDAVAVTDRLRSPGGDPWKQQQTHQSLAQYLLEEAYEAYDAIVTGDLSGLREEIGDVLLQVLLHARLAEELPEDRRWTIDDVAGDFVAKMVRRNPHVFADVEVADVAEVLENWERIKRAEKPRASLLDGVPRAQPALSLAAKVLERAERAGLPATDPAVSASAPDAPAASAPPAGAPAQAVGLPPGVVGDPDRLGAALLATVAAARAAGVDAEAALRRAALARADHLQP